MRYTGISNRERLNRLPFVGCQGADSSMDVSQASSRARADRNGMKRLKTPCNVAEIDVFRSSGMYSLVAHDMRPRRPPP